MNTLFSPYHLGSLALKNRVVMAPMTRSRALGNVPNELIRDHYAARASAGLLITEGIAPSPRGLGYARIPGLYSEEQVEGFRAVTDAVHERGGHIFAQVMHTGRIGHELNFPGGHSPLAPSAVRAEEMMHTDQEGSVPMSEPRAMSAQELIETRGEFVSAAENARRAGFDGIELHSANGYLLEQFLSPHTNRRDNEYGGSVENRARFVLETTKEVASAIGPDRVGVRLSPFNTFNDMKLYDEVEAQYRYVVSQLNALKIAYVHIVLTADPRAREFSKELRRLFSGAIIKNGGYDAETAEQALSRGEADLISFGRPFLANPDLVERFRKKAPLATPDFSLLYTPGAKGYNDYPPLSA
jgi:N-ethylmaleimide reductase